MESAPVLLPKLKENPRFPAAGAADGPPPPQILAPDSGGPDRGGPDREGPDNVGPAKDGPDRDGPAKDGPLGLGSKIPKDEPMDDVGNVSGRFPGKFPSTLDLNKSSLLFIGETPNGMDILSSAFGGKPIMAGVALGEGDEILVM